MPEITKLDRYIIEKVKEKRLNANLSQIALSQLLGMNDSFVGHVETPMRRAKYNINHVNELAKVFKCSLWELVPEKPF